MKYIVIIEHNFWEWYDDEIMIMTAQEFQEFKEAYEVFVKYRSSVQEEEYVSDCDIFGDGLYSGDEEHDTALRFWLKYRHHMEGAGDLGNGYGYADITGVKYITTEDKDFIDL
jgi:hypothetical protein